VRIFSRAFRRSLISSGTAWPISGLIHYWKLEEANLADRLDSVGALPFVATNQAVPRVTGIHNHAAQVDSNSILTANFQEPPSFSIALWVKTAGSVTDPTEVLFKNGLSFQFDLQIAPDGTVLWYVSDPVNPLDSGSEKVTFGQWNFIVASYGSLTSRVSVNGGTGNFTVQGHTPEDSGMVLYNGTSGIQVLVDEFSFYNRELSPADIAALWAGGAGLFL